MTINDKLKIIDQFIEDHVLPFAKGEIEKNGSVQPRAYLFVEDKEPSGDGKEGSILECELSFDDNEEKYRVYADVARDADLHGAFAAVLLNDAYMKSYPADSPEAKKFAENYKPGDLSQDDEAVECLIVSSKGPGLPPRLVHCPYRKNDLGEIEWLPEGNRDDYSQVHVTLLPDWY